MGKARRNQNQPLRPPFGRPYGWLPYLMPNGIQRVEALVLGGMLRVGLIAIPPPFFYQRVKGVSAFAFIALLRFKNAKRCEKKC